MSLVNVKTLRIIERNRRAKIRNAQKKNQPTNNNADKHSYQPESDYTYSLRKFNKTKMSCVERNRKQKKSSRCTSNRPATNLRQTNRLKIPNELILCQFQYSFMLTFIRLFRFWLAFVRKQLDLQSLGALHTFASFIHVQLIFSFVWLHNFGYVVYRVWFFFFRCGSSFASHRFSHTAKIQQRDILVCVFLVNRIC